VEAGRGTPFFGRLSEEGSSVSSTKYTNYDLLGRVLASAQKTAGISYPSFSYQYKLNDALSQITYPSGRLVTYGYDTGGRVASVTGLNGGITTDYTKTGTTISYAPHGAISSLTFKNNIVETRDYNSRLQPLHIQASGLLTLGYDYGTTQNNGNLQSQTITRGSQTWNQTYAGCYDGANRLTCASESGAGSWSQGYGYDNFGNRWLSGSSGLPSPTNQVPNGNWFSGNRVTSSPSGAWTYGASGNLEQMAGMSGWSFHYDAENRMKDATTANSPTTTYTYDGEGRRVTKNWNSQVTTFVYDAFGNLAAEYGGPPNTSVGTQYLTTDHLGSTRLVTDSSGAAVKCYDYLPFGEEIGNGTAGRASSCLAMAFTL
jgi:YD repeat-containing protein